MLSLKPIFILFFLTAFGMNSVGWSDATSVDQQSTQKFRKRGGGKYARICGKIESRDGNIIKVKTPKGKTKEFTLTPETIITSKGVKTSDDQIKPGASVKLLRFQKSDHHI